MRQKKKVQEMEAFVKKVIASGTPWTDADFPPEAKSLHDPKVDSKAEAAKFAGYTWKRLGQIYQKPKMFCDGIEPNDIN